MSYSVNFSILLVAYFTIFETFHRLSWYCPGGQKHRRIHTCHWFRVVFGILWLLLLLCVLLFLEKRLIFLHQDVLGITVTNLTKKKVLTMCFILQEAILGYIEHFLGYVPQFLGNSLMFSHEILCISSSLHSDGHYEKKIFGSCATCRLFWLCFSV